MTKREFNLLLDTIKTLIESEYDKKGSKITSYSVGKMKYEFNGVKETIEVWAHIKNNGVKTSINQSFGFDDTRDEVEKNFQIFRNELKEEGVEI